MKTSLRFVLRAALLLFPAGAGAATIAPYPHVAQHAGRAVSAISENPQLVLHVAISRNRRRLVDDGPAGGFERTRAGAALLGHDGDRAAGTHKVFLKLHWSLW